MKAAAVSALRKAVWGAVLLLASACAHDLIPNTDVEDTPETRDVVQTIYIRRVQKVGGELVNVPFDKIEKAKDPTRARGG